MIEVVSAVIANDAGDVLVALRSAGASAGSCWETPGGKVDPGESHEQALRREIREELGVELASVGKIVADVVVPGRRAALHVVFYACTMPAGAKPRRLAGQERLCWAHRDKLADRRMTPGNMAAMGKIINYLRKVAK